MARIIDVAFFELDDEISGWSLLEQGVCVSLDVSVFYLVNKTLYQVCLETLEME